MNNVENTTKLTECPEPSYSLLNTSDPLYRIPVFLSYATPYNDLQSLFLDIIIAKMRKELLFPRTLGRSDQYVQTPLTDIRRMILSSYGMLAIAFRRTHVIEAVSRPGTSSEQTFRDFWLSSPYLQIEPSMAYQQGLPLMIMVENGVSQNNVFGGILEQGAAPLFIPRFSLDDEQSICDFFRSVFWRETFADWVGMVRNCYNRLTQPCFKCNSCDIM